MPNANGHDFRTGEREERSWWPMKTTQNISAVDASVTDKNINQPGAKANLWPVSVLYKLAFQVWPLLQRLAQLRSSQHIQQLGWRVTEKTREKG